MIKGKFPSLRLRRSRKNDWSRRLIEENNLTPNDFILPIFLIDGKNKKQSIKSMPGVYRYSLDKINPIIDPSATAETNSVLSLKAAPIEDEFWLFCFKVFFESLSFAICKRVLN